MSNGNTLERMVVTRLVTSALLGKAQPIAPKCLLSLGALKINFIGDPQGLQMQINGQLHRL
jgi:hypothetical protein